MIDLAGGNVRGTVEGDKRRFKSPQWASRAEPRPAYSCSAIAVVSLSIIVGPADSAVLAGRKPEQKATDVRDGQRSIGDSGVGGPTMSTGGVNGAQDALRGAGENWWARQGSNLRPLGCKPSALPLSYTPQPQARRSAGVQLHHALREATAFFQAS